MNLNIQDADRLGKSLAKGNAGIPSKGEQNAIQTSMLLQTGPDELSIIVADVASHQMRLSIPAQVLVHGATLVPGDYFSKLIARLGNKPLSVSIVDNQLVVTTVDSGTHKFDLFQGEPEDFPVDYDMPPVAAVVDADALQEALKAILIAATGAEQEIIFQGKSDNNEKSLLISTEEYLTTRSRMALTDLNFDFTFAIPKSTLVGGRLPEFTGPVQIHYSPDKVVFSQNNDHLLIRRLSPPPDIDYIDDLLGVQSIGRIIVSLQQLRNRVHIIALGKPTCLIHVKGKTTKELIVTAEEQGKGNSVMPITVQGVVFGTTKDIKMDVNLFEKALKTVDGEDVILDWVDTQGDGQAVTLRLSNEANPEKRQTMLQPLQS